MLYAVHCTTTKTRLGYIEATLWVAAFIDRNEHDNAQWGIELVEVNPRDVDGHEFPSRINTVGDFAAWMRPGTGE